MTDSHLVSVSGAMSEDGFTSKVQVDSYSEMPAWKNNGNFIDEHLNQYRRMGVADADIPDVMEIASRVRNFFWWEKALLIMRAYWSWDVDTFHENIQSFFLSSQEVFSGHDIEMLFDQIPMNKRVPTTCWLVNKCKNLTNNLMNNLLINYEGIKEIRSFLIRNSSAFYELWWSRKMTGANVHQKLYPESVSAYIDV